MNNKVDIHALRQALHGAGLEGVAAKLDEEQFSKLETYNYTSLTALRIAKKKKLKKIGISPAIISGILAWQEIQQMAEEEEEENALGNGQVAEQDPIQQDIIDTMLEMQAVIDEQQQLLTVLKQQQSEQEERLQKQEERLQKQEEKLQKQEQELQKRDKLMKLQQMVELAEWMKSTLNPLFEGTENGITIDSLTELKKQLQRAHSQEDTTATASEKAPEAPSSTAGLE